MSGGSPSRGPHSLELAGLGALRSFATCAAQSQSQAQLHISVQMPWLNTKYFRSWSLQSVTQSKQAAAHIAAYVNDMGH